MVIVLVMITTTQVTPVEGIGSGSTHPGEKETDSLNKSESLMVRLHLCSHSINNAGNTKFIVTVGSGQIGMVLRLTT